MSDSEIASSERAIRNTRGQLDLAQRELERILNQQPSRRPGYRIAEVMIDTFRLCVPAAIAIYWLCKTLGDYLGVLFGDRGPIIAAALRFMET